MSAPRARVAPRHRAIVVLLVGVAGATASGCLNPFLPSQPQLPSTSQAVANVPLSFGSLEELLGTLSAAAAAKGSGNGVSAWIAAFADSEADGFGFRVDFDPAVVADLQAASKPIPPTWTAKDEAKFYNRMVGLNGGDYALSWAPYGAGEVDDSDDHKTLFREYHVHATRADGFTVDNVSEGKAEIELRLVPLSPPRWVIVRWTDTLLEPDLGPDPTDHGLHCFSRIRIDSFSD